VIASVTNRAYRAWQKTRLWGILRSKRAYMADRPRIYGPIVPLLVLCVKAVLLLVIAVILAFRW
jgi:hypothetical protein